MEVAQVMFYSPPPPPPPPSINKYRSLSLVRLIFPFPKLISLIALLEYYFPFKWATPSSLVPLFSPIIPHPPPAPPSHAPFIFVEPEGWCLKAAWSQELTENSVTEKNCSWAVFYFFLGECANRKKNQSWTRERDVSAPLCAFGVSTYVNFFFSLIFLV